MTRTHLRKILNDIRARPGRTFLVAASIFVGVLGVITLFTVRDLITTRLENDLDEADIAMIEVAVGLKAGQPVDNAADLVALNDPATLPGLTVVEGRAFHSAAFKVPGADFFESGQLRAYSAPLPDIQIEPLRLLAGDYPAPGQPEVALEKRMADAHGLDVGDDIIFQVATADGPAEVTYRVVGLIYHPYSYRAPSSLGGLSPGPEVGIYAPYQTAQNLLGFQGFNRLVARFETYAQAETHLNAFQQRIRQQTGYDINLTETENPAENRQIANAENFNNVLTMLAFVAMLVSGLLVINVTNTIVVEQKQQIGAMKALGASRGDIFKIYVGVALAYGIIGTLLAIPPAIGVGYATARNLAPLLDVLLGGFDWSPQAVALGVGLGLLVPVLSAIWPVYNGTRTTILEAITDLGISLDYGAGLLANAIKRLPMPIALRQALNNINRRKARLALTGLTLTSAVAAFMGVSAVGVSLTTVTRDVFDRLNYEILIVPNELLAAETIQQTIEGVPGVEKASTGTVVPITLGDDYVNFFTGDNQIVIYGIDPQVPSFHFQLIAGTGWQTDADRGGLIISSGLAEQLDLAVGDSLQFSVLGQTHQRPVIGIDRTAFESVWMHWQELSEIIGLRTLQIGDQGGQPLPNGYYVALSDADASPQAVDAAIEDISAALLANGITIQEVRNQVKESEETVRLIDQNIGILNVAAALIALVGGIGLLTTLAMAVFERQKEIGVMRAIGAASHRVAAQFVLEGVIIGLIAWLIAIPLSYGLALALNQALNLDTIKFVYPVRVLGVGLAGMVLIALAASLGPSLVAARKTVSSILRYQ